MGLISWIIIGALAGWLANKIIGKGERKGCFTNIIVGIVGAFIGGFVLSFFGKEYSVDGLNIESILIATLGAIILLWLSQKVFKK